MTQQTAAAGIDIPAPRTYHTPQGKHNRYTLAARLLAAAIWTGLQVLKALSWCNLQAASQPATKERSRSDCEHAATGQPTCISFDVLQAPSCEVSVTGQLLLHHMHIGHQRSEVTDHGVLFQLGHCVNALVTCSSSRHSDSSTSRSSSVGVEGTSQAASVNSTITHWSLSSYKLWSPPITALKARRNSFLLYRQRSPVGTLHHKAALPARQIHASKAWHKTTRQQVCFVHHHALRATAAAAAAATLASS